MSGRKTKTDCHIRLMNAHDGSSVTPGAFQSGMTLSVAMSAMKVMKKDAPSSAPRIGRNESDRNSKNESIHATLPRTPFCALPRLDRVEIVVVTAAGGAATVRPVISGSALMSL